MGNNTKNRKSVFRAESWILNCSIFGDPTMVSGTRFFYKDNFIMNNEA